MDTQRSTPPTAGASEMEKGLKPYVAPEVRLLGRMSERTLAGAGSRFDSNSSRGNKVRIG